MDWNVMEPIGASFILGDWIENTYIPADDCQEVLEEMLTSLLNDDPRTGSFRKGLIMEKVVEKDVIPLIKAVKDVTVFNLAVRFFANLTQPSDICIQEERPHNNPPASPELESFITSAKNQCTDVAFFKAISDFMKELLKQQELGVEAMHCLNHCLLLLRNLLHMKSGTSSNEQISIAHQCLLSSFFMNEIDKIIVAMLQHKYKAAWTIGIAQLISFIFKDYSSTLLEPDIDDSTSSSVYDEPQDLADRLTSATAESHHTGSTSRHLTSKFKDNLHICSSVNGSSCSPGDDDFMLEFNSTEDGQLEIKLTKCSQDSVEDMEDAPSPDSKPLGQAKGVSSTSLNNDCGGGREGKDYFLLPDALEKEVMSSINSSSCLMDMDIFVSYLKKFATDIVYHGFVDLVENIMKAMLTKYDSILDPSFLIWTVGFFLNFAHQQDLEFANYKEILNLDLFGFLVYEGVKSSESLAVQHQQNKDCSVDRHRLHLIVCSLNQMFRTLLANSKTHQAFDYTQNLHKCLSHMTDLHNLFVLLIRHYVAAEQSMVYLCDLVQTNHLLMLMIEEWLGHCFIGDGTGFNMLSHVNQFATKQIMAKYSTLLEQRDQHKETLNIAVLTMMYHVAGDCKRQDTLMQMPILKTFSDIWMENAVHEHTEFKDLIEFVLEMFMSDAEKNPNECAQKLFFDQNTTEETSEMECSGTFQGESSGVSSSEMLGEEEEVLIFTWMAEIADRSDVSEIVVKKLREHGFSRSQEVVTKYLADKFPSMSPPTSSSPSKSTQSHSHSSSKPREHPPPLHENTEILHELSSVSEDNLIPFLLDKLRGQGFESQLVWLQKQLLETAYIKLGIKEPAYRIHVEEPVARFYALQGKSIPMVLWNDELQKAQTDPYFQLLQQSLGLYTYDNPSIIHPRIPHYLTPTLLVNKARQVGSIETLLSKFDVDTLKKGSDFDIAQDESQSVPSHQKKMEMFKPIHNVKFNWLNMIQNINQAADKGSM